MITKVFFFNAIYHYNSSLFILISSSLFSFVVRRLYHQPVGKTVTKMCWAGAWNSFICSPTGNNFCYKRQIIISSWFLPGLGQLDTSRCDVNSDQTHVSQHRQLKKTTTAWSGTIYISIIWQHWHQLKEGGGEGGGGEKERIKDDLHVAVWDNTVN